MTATDCHWLPLTTGGLGGLTFTCFVRQTEPVWTLDRVIISAECSPATCLLRALLQNIFSFENFKTKSSVWPGPPYGGRREREREREQFVENIHRHLGLNILGPLSQREGKMSVSVFKISVDTQTLTIFRSANGRRGRDIIDRRYLANITLTNTDTHNIQARHYRSQIKADTT